MKEFPDAHINGFVYKQILKKKKPIFTTWRTKPNEFSVWSFTSGIMCKFIISLLHICTLKPSEKEYFSMLHLYRARTFELICQKQWQENIAKKKFDDESSWPWFLYFIWNSSHMFTHKMIFILHEELFSSHRLVKLHALFNRNKRLYVLICPAYFIVNSRYIAYVSKLLKYQV